MKLRILVMILLCALFLSASHAQTKLPPETRNAALRYWLAFAALKDPPADKETQELLQKTLSGISAWDEQKLGPILDANQESLGIFARARNLPDCDWGLEYGRDVAASIAYVPRARVLAKLNTLQGIRDLSKGDTQAAVDAWTNGIHFSEQLTHGGSLIFGLVAKETMLPNLQWLTTETTKGQLSARQKKQVMDQLKALPEDGIDWATTWGLEGAGAEQFLTSSKAAAEYQAMTNQAPVKGCVPPAPEELKKFQEYLAQVQSSLHASPQEAKLRMEALELQRSKLCASEQAMIPNAQKTNEARLQLRAAKDALQQALRGN